VGRVFIFDGGGRMELEVQEFDQNATKAF
jgi:hypothetical protein